jgi:hypothetical protein
LPLTPLRESTETRRYDAGGFLFLTRCLGLCTHTRRLKQRPDIGAPVAADLADEQRLKIGEPDMIGPAVASGRCLVFLVRAPRDNLEGIILQRSLQRLRLISGRAHPDVALLVAGQDRRHRLWIDRRHH